MYLLLIETATQVCSISISNEKEILTCKETNTPNSHSSVINQLIDQCLHDSQIEPGQLSAVVFSKGPGSYTGLRIGLSTAKGLCYGLNIPLITVSTLESMAHGAYKLQNSASIIYLPMIDARRMEVYTASYDSNLKEIKAPCAAIIDEEYVAENFKNRDYLLFGSGAEKCLSLISSYNHYYLSDFQVTSASLLKIAAEKFNNSDFEDTAYYEPAYLKEFYSPTKRS